MSRLARLWGNAPLLLSLTMLFWAFNTVLGRFVVGEVPPIGLAFARWVGAGLIVLAVSHRAILTDFARLRNMAALERARALGLLALMGFTGVTVYNTTLYLGLQHTSAVNGVLITSTGPVLVAFWVFVLTRERLSAGQTLGIGLSSLGVAAIVLEGDPARLASLDLNQGDLLIAFGVLLYGLYSALLKRRPALHPMSFLFLTFWLGALFLAPAFSWELAEGRTLRLNGLTVATIAYVAVIPSILAYLFFNRGVALVGANRAAPFFHLMPVFGSAIAVVWLGEALRGYHLAGWALVLSGLFVATRRDGARKRG